MILKNPNTGELLETSLCDVDAVSILRPFAAQDEFISSLLGHREIGLTPAQRFWLFKKAELAIRPAPLGEQIGGSFARITAMFTRAAATLKRPKIHLSDSEGNEITLALAPATGSNRGFIYVKFGAMNDYAGKISPEGQFFSVPTCPATVTPYLKEFAQNPEEIAARYGKLTGRCCFCAKGLSDERSTSVGYGPICADKFGLAWGDATPLLPSFRSPVVITARTRVRL